MHDIKILNNKCKMGGGDNGPKCFVKDLSWVVNLVYKKEDSVSCWFKAHQLRQDKRQTGKYFCFCLVVLLLLLLLLVFVGFFNRFNDFT